MRKEKLEKRLDRIERDIKKLLNEKKQPVSLYIGFADVDCDEFTYIKDYERKPVDIEDFKKGETVYFPSFSFNVNRGVNVYYGLLFLNKYDKTPVYTLTFDDSFIHVPFGGELGANVYIDQKMLNLFELINALREQNVKL